MVTKKKEDVTDKQKENECVKKTDRLLKREGDGGITGL